MNDVIKCVAIDDEPLALDIIETFCRRIGNIELKKFSHPAKGLDDIRRERPDIVFLDIEMDGINGISIAAQLPPIPASSLLLHTLNTLSTATTSTPSTIYTSPSHSPDSRRPYQRRCDA